MQDSTNREWDDPFVDQAWGQMRRLLDEELPVAAVVPPRHRRGVILVFLLFGALLGGFSYYLYQFESSANPILENKTQGPVAGTILPAEDTSPIPQTAGPGQNIQLIEKNNTPLKNSKGDNDLRSTMPKNRLPLNSGITLNPGVAGSLETAGPTDKIPQKLPIAPGMETPKASKPPAGSAPIALLPLERDAFSDFLPLETTPLTLLASPISNPEPGTVTGAGRHQRILVGLETGATYYDQPGFLAGMQVQGRLAPRWRVQSGLWYLGYQSNLYERLSQSGNKQATEALKQPSNGLSPNNADPLAARTSHPYDFNLRLQLLTLPLSVNYRLFSKWSVGTGVQLHYLLKARRDALAQTDFSADLAQSYSTYQRRVIGLAEAGDRLDPDLFHKINAGWVGQIGFQPNKNLLFNLRFQQGLGNWFKEDTFIMKPSDVQLSAVYFFRR